MIAINGGVGVVGFLSLLNDGKYKEVYIMRSINPMRLSPMPFSSNRDHIEHLHRQCSKAEDINAFFLHSTNARFGDRWITRLARAVGKQRRLMRLARSIAPVGHVHDR